MNSWLKNTISLIEKDPKLGTVLFTNLQLYNNGQKFENLIDSWTKVFKLSLSDLLRVKGLMKQVDDENSLEEFQKVLESGQKAAALEGNGEIQHDLSFVSLLQGQCSIF